MILGLVAQAVAAGARQAAACRVVGINERTLERWRAQGIGADRRAGPRTVPANKLCATERARVLEIATSKEFRDLSPKQMVPILAERGRYVASEASVYRILREQDQVHHREKTRAPKKRDHPRALCARAPNRVWSWDITWLPSAVRGVFFRAYVVLDVWSRKIVAAEVFEEETSEHAADLIAQACRTEGVTRGSVVLHSDNGGAMKGATLLATLEELGVASSFSRPGVSNDNSYSEAGFRTMKYRPEYPSRPFETLETARAWLARFLRWYNTCHRHGGIGFVTPDQRHKGEDAAILGRRRKTYAAARRRHPQRWSRHVRPWTAPAVVTLNSPSKEMTQRASA